MISKLKNFLKGERGITGLETAIILIAFVVVAAVFAFTVLSAGVFSADRGKEAVYSGLAQVSGSMEVKGSVIGWGDTTNNLVSYVTFSLANVAGGEPINFTTPSDGNNNGIVDSGTETDSLHRVVIDYRSQDTRYTDLVWSRTDLGYSDDDDLLETGEIFEVTVYLNRGDVAASLGVSSIFVIEVKPETGGVLVIERTTPADIDPVMDLH